MNFAYGAQDRHDRALSVTEANRYVKSLMDNDALLSSICVRGEISNLKYHSSGHIYFTLKDEEAELSAVMFRSAAATLRFTAKNGMRVRAYGRITVYEKGGKCQIYVSAMVDDGIGALQLEYERLRNKLAAEGLFDTSRKRPIPSVPSKIGIITSPTGAAIRDMINVTGRRWPAAKIIIYPALVQGAGAPESLCRGLELLNAYNECDVIIIGRGGGSIEDLWAFNDERLVRSVAASQIPVISAVGHETDFTLCDFASDCRAPTPSAAAELAVPDRAEYRQRVDEARERLDGAVAAFVGLKKNTLASLNKQIELCSPSFKLTNEKKLLEQKKSSLERLAESVMRKNLDAFRAIAGKLSAMNPLAVLSRGYSVVKTEMGHVVTSSDVLRPEEELDLVFSKGSAKVKVSEINKENNHGNG